MPDQIDINSISYDVRLIDQNGNYFPLNNAITSLQLEELEDELAGRARISFAAADDGKNKLISLIKLNCPVVIYGRWNTAAKKLFMGNVWEWGYSHSSQKTLSITVCDPLIRLQQCQDFKYYSAGLTTKNIISDICKTWSIPLVYSFQSITHDKQIFDGIAVSDMITSLLNEVKQKTGSKFIVSYRDGAMRITGYGTNSVIYKFDGNVTISTSDNLSMNDLVTRVKILGTADDSGRSPVEAVLDGDTSFGILQSIIKREHDKTLADTNSEAQNIINENGTPQETISVTVPDLPFLHKGDAIEMNAANLIGTFFVTGVSHNVTAKTMTLDLTRKGSV